MVHTRIRLLRHVVPFDLRIHERCRGLRSIAVEHLDSATHRLHILLRHGLAVSRSAYVASDMARTLASAQESLARIVRSARSRTRWSRPVEALPALGVARVEPQPVQAGSCSKPPACASRGDASVSGGAQLATARDEEQKHRRWFREILQRETAQASTEPRATRSKWRHAAAGLLLRPGWRICSARDKTLTKDASPDASDASAKAHKMDDSDAGGPIDGGRIGLRALSCVNRVVVRVHSGA